MRLPDALRPLASAIVGDRPAYVSTSEASRRALAAVGRPAATTGDVIHLARTPTTSAADVEVLAHELTHVAHPSPAPRFFDDDRQSPEEQRAAEIGRIMREAPVLARTVSLTDPGASSAVAPMVMRSMAPSRSTTPPVPPELETVRASGLVQRSTSTPSPSSTGSASSSSVSSSPSSDSVVRRLLGTSTASNLGLDTFADGPDDTSVTTSDRIETFEHLLEMLEERILEELERRGGRYRGVF